MSLVYGVEVDERYSFSLEMVLDTLYSFVLITLTSIVIPFNLRLYRIVISHLFKDKTMCPRGNDK